MSMNTKMIIEEFQIIEKSLMRAKLPFETEMITPEIMKVSLWELLRSKQIIDNILLIT